MKKAKDDVSSKIRFSVGLLFIILNFIFGKAAVPLFVIEPTLAVVLYAISWAMLVAGVVLCGKEGWHLANRHIRKYEKIIVNAFGKRFPFSR